MRRIERPLVIGGAGFFGSWVVSALLEGGLTPTVVDLSPSLAEVDTVVGDLEKLDLEALLRERRIDSVFHLAGSASVPASVENPRQDLDANVGSTLAVLEAARSLDEPPVVVLASSAAVYGNSQRLPMDEEHPLQPVSPYGVSKLAAERYLQLYAETRGVPAFSVRPFSLYGPGQRKQVVYDLLSKVLAGEDPLTVLGSPDVSRDFVFAADAGRAIRELARHADGIGEAYNLASGRETTLGELVDMLITAAGAASHVQFTGAVRVGDPLRWAGDPSRAAGLGVRCDTPLAEGVRQTMEWSAKAERSGAQ